MRRPKRRVVYLFGMRLEEPARPKDFLLLWATMRPEERGEIEDAGCDQKQWFDAYAAARRTIAVKRGADLLAVAAVYDKPDGTRFLTYERTRHALEKGNRFSWLRGYAHLSQWLVMTEREQYARGKLLTASPTDLPRALAVYRHAGASVVGETEVFGRKYWILEVKGGK